MFLKHIKHFLIIFVSCIDNTTANEKEASRGAKGEPIVHEPEFTYDQQRPPCSPQVQ